MRYYHFVMIFLHRFLLGCRDLRLIMGKAAQCARSKEHCGISALRTTGEPLTMNARQHMSPKSRIQRCGSSQASRVSETHNAGYREAWALLRTL